MNIALLCLALLPIHSVREDVVLEDFEGTTFGTWTVAGSAFGSRPAPGALPNQMPVVGFEGRGFASSFHSGDDSLGTLTSAPFTISRPRIRFLIGGGKFEGRTCMNLIVDGRVVRTATGPNDRPGGSEELEPSGWDVSEFLGRQAVLTIVDDAQGGWGHISVDHIVLTDRTLPVMLSDVERSFRVEHRYLHVPIQNHAVRRRLTLLVDGVPVVHNEVELADGEPDWWAPMDVSRWMGRTVTLRVDQLLDESKALAAVEHGDSLLGAEDLYREPLRGQIRFSPRRGWLNDPNGLVFFNGEYHLFFQHNPYGWGWGNMHWGHAVSRDLVHWEELGEALLPDELGTMFSGSAVVDWNNTSGFGRPGQPALVLVYTASGVRSTQCIAYSTDGRTFTKYEGNPVLDQITPGNRDPKVFWHEPTRRWVMPLYVDKGGLHTVHLFVSTDLKEWTLASVVEGIPGSGFLFECPDMFELAVDGDRARSRWVLFGANGEYAIGTFDGERFAMEHGPLPGHRGRGYYAPQTFGDIPAHDGRRIKIGWFQTETRGMPFNQSMSIPKELGLTSTPDGPRLTFSPVRELQALRTRTQRWGPAAVEAGGANPLAEFGAELMEVSLVLEPGTAEMVELTLRGIPLRYEVETQTLELLGARAHAPLRDGKLDLHVFVDRVGLEVFASGGLVFMPMPVQPDPGALGLSLAVHGGSARLVSAEAHSLRSAWFPPPAD